MSLPNLRVTEIKAFVPSKDFGISKEFYKDLGFTLASEAHLLHHSGNSSA